MTILKTLLKYVAAQHGISEEAAAELLTIKSEDADKPNVLNPKALSILLEKDGERVIELKGEPVDKTKLFNDAFAKAKGEVLGKEEKRLAAKYKIDGKDLKLDDLVEKILSEGIAAAETPVDKITDDVVKAHPVYLQLEREKTKSENALTVAHEEAITELKTSYAKTDAFGKVKPLLLSAFNGLNPVLSDKAAVAANQTANFINKFTGYDYEEQTDGSWLILKDGKRLENKQGHPLTLEDFATQVTKENFDVPVQPDKDATGNGGNANGTVVVPATREAYDDAIFEATTQEEREAITAAYEAAENGD